MAEMGRPPVTLTEDQWTFLRTIAGVPKAVMTQDQIVSAMRGLRGLEKFSLSTLHRIIKETFGDEMTIDGFRQTCQGQFRSKILAKQVERAMKGSDNMLQWLGSNYIEQSSKAHIISESTHEHIIYDTQFGDQPIDRPDRTPAGSTADSGSAPKDSEALQPSPGPEDRTPVD